MNRQANRHVQDGPTGPHGDRSGRGSCRGETGWRPRTDAGRSPRCPCCTRRLMPVIATSAGIGVIMSAAAASARASTAARRSGADTGDHVTVTDSCHPAADGAAGSSRRQCPRDRSGLTPGLRDRCPPPDAPMPLYPLRPICPLPSDLSHRWAPDLGGSVSAARIFHVPGARLPSDPSHFFVARLALVHQDAARWLALWARRLRAARQTTSGYIAGRQRAGERTLCRSRLARAA